MEEIRHACAIVTGKGSVRYPCLDMRVILIEIIKNRGLDWFVHVLKRQTNSCEFTRIVIKAVANDDFICWWLSRILSVSVTVCVELLIDKSAWLSTCSADKKLWICVIELTVYKKAESWGH
jgi:hypothetical protein